VIVDKLVSILSKPARPSQEDNAPDNVDAIVQSILGRGSERFGPIKDLWQKWQQPHGHVSSLFVPGLTGRVLRWLSPRLEAGGKKRMIAPLAKLDRSVLETAYVFLPRTTDERNPRLEEAIQLL